ncbi:hypothetical protein GS497_26400 [Rhodococcus hoagii]|nr:hypothetical protein [Prescottella equi]
MATPWLATQVAGRLTSTTGVEIGVRDVFDAATAADLARTIETRVHGLWAAPNCARAHAARRRSALSPAQRRLWSASP